MEQDLRTLLTSIRDDAPPPRLSVDDITTAGRHLVRRRRRLALLTSAASGAVAAVAAVATALFISAPGGLTPAVDPSTLPNVAATTPPAEFADAPAFTTTYGGYEAGPYLIGAPDLVTTAYQQSLIDATIELSPAQSDSPEKVKVGVRDLLHGGSLVVYRAGAFDPRLFQKAEKIQVRTGVGLLQYAGGSNPSLPTSSPTADPRGVPDRGQPSVPTLAWQYTDNAWAAIYWSSWETVPARDALVAIADGLTPSQPKAFPIGFQPSNVPKGYTLLSVSNGSDMPTGNRIVSAARLTPKPPPVPLLAPIDFNSWPSVTLSLGRTVPDPKTVGKLDCASGNAFCSRASGDGSIYVSVELNELKPSGAVQPAQIVLGLHPENPEAPESWPPAIKVFQ
jgi:hypothetical protein